MKTKHAVFLTVIGILGTLGASSLAIEGQAPEGKMSLKAVKLAVFEPVVYLLKSHGEAIAGLRLRGGTRVEFESSGDPSGSLSYDAERKSLTASNGVTLRIVVGTNAVTVAADEVLTSIDPVAWSAVATRPSAKLIRLKSGGDSVAELKIAKGKTVEFQGKQGDYDLSGERTTMRGDVTVRISSAGVSPVVVKADEIEAVPDSE